jgi:hypothetical protein
MDLRSAGAEFTGFSASAESARFAKTRAIPALYTGFGLTFRL